MSAILFTIKKSPDKEIDKKGIIYALISACFFGISALIQKWVTNNGFIYTQQLYFAISLFVAAIVYVIIKGNHINKLKEMIPRNKLLAVTSGCIYCFATYFSTLSFKYLPASIAFTVTQMCAVWSVLIGILIFKEIDFKKNWLRILAGIAFTLVGVLILLLA